MNWQEFLDILFCSSCKKQNLELLDKWQDCQGLTRAQATTITKLEKQNEQLKLLVPHPVPPEVDYIIEKDTIWVQQVIDGLGLGIIRIPLDAKYYLTNRKNFLNIVAYDWVDSWEYIPDVGDCDKSAIAFKSHTNWIFRLNNVGVVIDYSSGHAYILVIYANGKVDVLEPQSDGLYLWTERPEVFYPLKGAIVLL